MTNQNDFVIDNGTGLAVRTDIQDALQALAGNSSGNSEPSVKYAYQWWADSNAAVMKLRNSANDGWIELFQLDGTLTLEDGTNSAPALAFRDDLNTGIYSSAADAFNIATGGINRLEIGTAFVINETGVDLDFRIESDANANCFMLDASTSGIGINVAPTTGYALDIVGNSGYDDVFRLTGVGTNIGPRINLTPTGTGTPRINATSGFLAFQVGGATQMSIGNTGTKPVLIGTSVINSNDKLTVHDAGDVFMSIRSDAEGDNTRQFLDFGTGTADRASANQTGCIFATIHSQSGGTLKSDLAFQTNSGDSINTKMTIRDTGRVGIGTATPSSFLELDGQDTAYGGVGNATTTVGAKITINDGAGRKSAFFGASAGDGGIGSITNNNFNLLASNVAKCTLMSHHLNDGAFLIGTSTNNLSTSAFGHAIFYDGATVASRNVTGSNAVTSFLGNAGTFRTMGDGDAENTNGTFIQISDIKFKENIVDANSQWDDIKAIKVRNFNFKSSTGFSTHKQIGIVAQELEFTSPSLVKTVFSDMKQTESHKSVLQSIVYMKAVKCLQEAMARIEVLETKVAALEAA